MNDDANDNNTSKTLQSLRDDLNNYLSDVDQVFPSPEDNERPEYKNESNGYLKFRDLNQGMIIRSTTNPYIQGLNPELYILCKELWFYFHRLQILHKL